MMNLVKVFFVIKDFNIIILFKVIVIIIMIIHIYNFSIY